MKKYKESIIATILSLILVLFIWHKLGVSGNSTIFILIGITSYHFLKSVLGKKNKRKFIVSGIIALLFASIEIICWSINKDYTLNNIINKWLLFDFAGYTILAWSIITTIYTFLESHNLKFRTIKIKKVELLSTSKISFLINVLLIILSWLPYYLTYYPGILSIDSSNQIFQAVGITPLSNHHPIFHTGIIAIWINLGTILFNNFTDGVALYSAFQMVIMAVCFSITLRYLAKKKVPTIIRVLVLLYYMFYPVHALYSIVMWKDILFAGMFLVFMILYSELILSTDEFFFSKTKNIAIFIIVVLLTVLLRNNAIYAIILLIPLMLIAVKKYWKETLTIFLLPIIIYLVIKILVFPLLEIEEGGIQEMLSIPLQQIARVEKYHKDELDEETLNEINKYFKCENIGEKYNPILSDPVKDEFNEEYFKGNKLQFIRIWFKLSKTYFKDYVESFISNSYGYYYPEATYWICPRDIDVNAILFLGIEQRPLIDKTFISTVDLIIDKRDIPLISMFFSIGTIFWLIVISIGYKIYKKEYRMTFVYLPILALWVTLLASPVFCEFRYAYSMFTILPLYIGLNFIKRNENKKV